MMKALFNFLLGFVFRFWPFICKKNCSVKDSTLYLNIKLFRGSVPPIRACGLWPLVLLNRSQNSSGSAPAQRDQLIYVTFQRSILAFDPNELIECEVPVVAYQRRHCNPLLLILLLFLLLLLNKLMDI